MRSILFQREELLPLSCLKSSTTNTLEIWTLPQRMAFTARQQLFLKVSLGISLVLLIAKSFDTSQLYSISPTLSLARPTIAKVSVLYGEENKNLQRAVASHRRHAELHHYPTYVLERPVANGYWNKALYLLSILVQELSKPTSARVEWLMYIVSTHRCSNHD